MRPLFVGQAPIRGADDRPPFQGPCGDRLAMLLGIPRVELDLKLDLRNLLARWPGKDGRGDAFSMPAARIAACEMVGQLRAESFGGRVILAGRGVAAAFDVPRDLPYLTWIPFRAFQFAVFPHPSGLNRWWNSPENRAAATRFLSAAVE